MSSTIVMLFMYFLKNVCVCCENVKNKGVCVLSAFDDVGVDDEFRLAFDEEGCLIDEDSFCCFERLVGYFFTAFLVDVVHFSSGLIDETADENF